MTIKADRINAFKALKRRMPSEAFNSVDDKFDSLLREVYGIPERPKDSQPYTWLVGEQTTPPPTDTALERGLDFVLRWEGGYVNHPNDRGGATNKGVIQSTYNAYRDDKGLSRRSVRHISNDEVQEIYRDRYWKAARCHEIAERSESLAIAHFDWAVNAGTGRAIKTLQECTGTIVDGVWGPNTRKSFEATNPNQVLNCYLNRREQLYRRWGRGSQAVFLDGWLNRLNDLREFLR